jgi:hypothetical protein
VPLFAVVRRKVRRVEDLLVSKPDAVQGAWHSLAGRLHVFWVFPVAGAGRQAHQIRQLPQGIYDSTEGQCSLANLTVRFLSSLAQVFLF